MKDQNLKLYKRISLLAQIIFGLILLCNGVMLLINYFGLASFEAQFSKFFIVDSFFKKSIYEWRYLVDFTHIMIATHISAFVMIFLGVILLAAAIYSKKSP